MSWDCGFKYIFALSPTLKAGVMCKLQERDDIGRIELVQKLARENCQFLQTDRKEPEKPEQVRAFLLGGLRWKGWGWGFSTSLFDSVEEYVWWRVCLGWGHPYWPLGTVCRLQWAGVLREPFLIKILCHHLVRTTCRRFGSL